ncbi:hypothetical protein ACLOJK_025332 [Asimina triloba]
MSLDEEIDKGDKPAFKWGKKRCMGGAKRSIPIYESFTYDEVEYFLYDCVYLYKDGEVEPYIGKLIKIWELPNGEKKIKVLWFFRPVEIRNYLRDNVALEKELFLASGEGVGLVNVNPLEAIAGKCNVVCISKDKRNTEPSEEEIKRADFIFFRTFDVGKLSISDDIVGTIAGQDVNFIFNKKRPETSDILKSEATAKDNNAKVVASNAAQLLSKLDLQGTNKDVVKDDKVVRASSSVAKDVDSRASLLNSGKRALDERCSDDNNIQRKKIKVDDDKNSKASLAQSDVRAKLKPGDKNSKDSLAQSDDRAKLKPVDKNGKDFLAQSDDKAKLKPGDDLAKPDSRLFKKVKVNDNSSKSEVQYNISRPIVSDNDKASEALINSSEDKLNAIAVFSSIRWDTETSKRVKLDEKTKLADESLQKLSAAAPDREIKTNGQVVEVSRMPDVVTNNQKASEVPISCIEGKLKPITASSSIGRDMGTSKKMKLDAKKTKLVDESLPKTSEAAPEKDIKTQAVEFNRRPDAVNNNDKDSEVPISSTEGKLKPSTVNSLSGQDMGTSKKVKLDERKTKLAYESSQKTSEAAPDKDIKSQTIEVTRRPEALQKRVRMEQAFVHVWNCGLWLRMCIWVSSMALLQFGFNHG